MLDMLLLPLHLNKSSPLNGGVFIFSVFLIGSLFFLGSEPCDEDFYVLGVLETGDGPRDAMASRMACLSFLSSQIRIP